MDFSEFEQKCLTLLANLPKSRSKFCFRSAITHLEKAETLLNIDPAMAIFRLITAEEEASSGLMYCLKELGYDNAEKLLPRNHNHKNAIAAFFMALSLDFKSFIKEHGFTFHLRICNTEDNPNLELGIRNPAIFGDATLSPEPPLHFVATTGIKRRSFTDEINQIAKSVGKDSIIDFIKAEANVRNQILYANESGVPHVAFVQDTFIQAKTKRIFALLNVYLLIRPHAEQQLFVQQALDAFLVMLKAIPIGDLHPES